MGCKVIDLEEYGLHVSLLEWRSEVGRETCEPYAIQFETYGQGAPFLSYGSRIIARGEVEYLRLFANKHHQQYVQQSLAKND